ncbi:GGDEF domain-containing protein [Pseudoalteromonas sp. BSi20495]|uniref:GGDEF domain-containing protein n=1 Tax=Pseudoalteromonas sp. BSi20495 TaxID=386429 RepID=UPI001F5822AB|nr:GGDEF domain-containing protein [Pseudoalteromonas sp. BSi20495]
MHKYFDKTERELIVRFFSSIGFISTFLMSCIAFINSEYFLFVTLFGSSLIYIWAFNVYKEVEKSANAILYNLYGLMLYLVVTGGAEGTGPIWIFIVSPVTYSIRGLKRGTSDIFIFLLAIMLGFYCADMFNIYEYKPAQFPYRIVFSFIIVALLTGFYEQSREKYSNKIIALSQRNERLATIDPLTELPNRRHAMNKLSEFKKEHAYKGIPFVLLLADVDNFKKINDKYGHNFGDEALIHLAKIFKKNIPQNAVASRWGGEEFLIAIPNVSVTEGVNVADKIHDSLKKAAVSLRTNTVNLTISIGVVQSEENRSIDLDIKHADQQLYKAKEQGKNRTCSA